MSGKRNSERQTIALTAFSASSIKHVIPVSLLPEEQRVRIKQTQPEPVEGGNSMRHRLGAPGST